MKARIILLMATALFNFTTKATQAQQQYKIQDVPIRSRWAKQVSPENTLKEYPRPQMVRASWINLNGLWDYVITPKNNNLKVLNEGKILVPYPIESALSGVKKALQPDQYLIYKRTITKPVLHSGEHVLLHFGAVDYQCWVYINGKEVGSHTGGYTSFDMDITEALISGTNELMVKVYDPTDKGNGPHGKQVLNPANIYYTPSSGIWQTVWMETVPVAFISELKMTPDIDKGLLNLRVKAPEGYKIEATAFDGKTKVNAVFGEANEALQLPVKNAKLWSPASPFLYDLEIKLLKDGKVVDKVTSYFGMRKIGIAKDAAGVDRIFLNNKAYYNLGTLDQGFWPEGLYTAPTDEALSYDIKAIKAMGFNTIRKHIKVEPARWYYHADKLGMLIWQDMVNPNQGLQEGAKAAFEAQCKETLEQLYNYPSITTWVLFNEKWGQYDQQRLTEWIKTTDPSRIVNGHSGELLYVNEQLRSPSPNAYVSADMTDVHSYPDPMMSIKQTGKAQVCGEFGGIGVFIPDHQWNTSSAWGYITEKPSGLKAKYTIVNQHLQLMEKQGLSGSIYTQPFDVEGEQNGLMTYDREVIKIPFAELRKIHAPLNPEVASPNWLAMTSDVTAKEADLTEPAQLYADAVAKYMKGKREPAFLKRLTMMAGQTNDLAGKARFGTEYLATLKEPYNVDDIAFIEGMTSKVTDKGFAILMERAKTDRLSYVKVMNIIFADVIQAYVPKPESKPDWAAVEAAVKPYGLPGEEIFLRAKTIHLYNQKDWDGFKQVASIYLEKYGTHIGANEKKMLEEKL